MHVHGFLPYRLSQRRTPVRSLARVVISNVQEHFELFLSPLRDDIPCDCRREELLRCYDAEQRQLTKRKAYELTSVNNYPEVLFESRLISKKEVSYIETQNRVTNRFPILVAASSYTLYNQENDLCEK